MSWEPTPPRDTRPVQKTGASARPVNCPSCSTGKLAPLTGVCDLCGYSSGLAAISERAIRAADLARQELTHEFELLDPIGYGARSAVFQATELASGKRVIVKVVLRDNDSVEEDQLFRAALAAHTGFDHPHLVAVTRFGITDGLRWYTREDIGATALSEVLQHGVTFDARTCRRIATQLTSALDYLHRRGIVHCALRPENVLMDRNGWAHLCDPAYVLETAGERPSWRAPEDFERGERLPVSDQYALAALVFQCLTGKAPKENADEVIRSRTDLPHHLAGTVLRGMSREPRDRFASLADFVWALEAGAPSLNDARPATRTTEGVMFISDWENPERRVSVPWGLIGGIGLAAALVGGIWLALPIIEQFRAPPPTSIQATNPPTTSAVAQDGQGSSTVGMSAASAQTGGGSAAPQVGGGLTGGQAGSGQVPPQVGGQTFPQTQAPVARPAVMVEPGRLFVNATPWGQLYIDGELIGNTPRVNLEVSAGERAIRIVREGFEPYERTISVEAGETVRLTNIVLVPRAQ